MICDIVPAQPAWTSGDQAFRNLVLLGPESYLLYVNALRPDLRVSSMLSVAEGKIGPKELVRCFNLPPAETCCQLVDGQAVASPVCRAVCYAHKMSQGRPGVLLRAQKNLQLAQRPDFAELVVGAIRLAAIEFCKIHVVGDFFSVEYIHAWSRVAALLPTVGFWTYTRAWRVPSLIPALERLAAHENVAVFLSYDSATGIPPTIRGTRLAWLASHDEDVPLSPSHVAFRASVERHSVSLTRLGSSLVCPHQSGPTPQHLSCIDCGHCLPSEHSASPQHHHEHA